MGGKALNKYGIYTERKSTEEFYIIGQKISSIIEDNYPVNCSIVKCYHNKENHGDLDLLIRFEKDIRINWRELIINRFNPKAINSNGNVYSFDYDNFQIDLIPISDNNWEIANVYYSYDPLGNIMGKTFHKFGLSYGWDGLYYKYRNFNGVNSQNILISKNPRKIFEFAGYNYDKYLKGFDDLKQIIEFAIDTKYFNSEIFQMENLKAIDKKRNRKRGSYHLFLKYLKDNNINIKYDFIKDKNSYLPLINQYFPEVNLMNELNKLEKENTRNKILSQKFNGNLIMSWIPNLQGKELGKIIGNFKNVLGDEYEEFILNSSYDTIYNKFMKIYNDEE